MIRSSIHLFFSRFLLCVICTIALPACTSPGARANLVLENDGLKREKDQLERSLAQRDAVIRLLHRQIENLKTFQADRPADLFAPVKLEIASLSGGDDYDGKPGDDGVTVYLRLRDADGDLVKAPGKITIELLDPSQTGTPQSLGVYRFDDPQQVRRLWHGRFGTRHYTLKCPFSSRIDHSSSRKVIIRAKFEDYLTGRTFTDVKEVEVSFGNE